MERHGRFILAIWHWDHWDQGEGGGTGRANRQEVVTNERGGGEDELIIVIYHPDEKSFVRCSTTVNP